jgi:hypothetical protein
MVKASNFNKDLEGKDPLRKVASVFHVMDELGLDKLWLPDQEAVYDAIISTLIMRAKMRKKAMEEFWKTHGGELKNGA